MALLNTRYKLVPALLLAWLTGCAALQAPVPAATPTPAAVVPVPGGQSAPVQLYRPEDLPALALDYDILIRVLVGDVAAQKGEYPLAFESWMDVARRTRDPRAAQRAFEIGASAAYFEQALTAVRLWVETAPTAVRPRQLMVALLIRTRHIDEVEPHLLALLSLNSPQDTPGFLLQMHQLWPAETDRKLILPINERLVARYPQLPEAYFAKAVTLVALARNPDAIAALDAGLALRPGWEPATLYRAQLLPVAERLAYLESAPIAKPASREYLLLLASTQVEASQIANARKSYEAVLARWPEDAEALTGAGVLTLQMGDFALADTRLQRVLGQKPANADTLRYYLGQSAEMQFHYREALDWYLQIGNAMSNKAAPRIARLHARLGARDLAFKAVDAMPEASSAEQTDKLQARAQVWRELKDYAKALEVLAAAIKARPEAHELLLERSLVADLQGDYALSEADLRRYMAANPNEVSAWNALGYTLASRTDKLAEAEVLISRALQSEPDNPAYIDSMGWLRFRQGRVAEARELLAKAYARFPDPEVAIHYAEVLLHAGDRAAAKAVLDRTEQRLPGEETIPAARKRLGL